MGKIQGFVAYGSLPGLIGETIEAGAREAGQRSPEVVLRTWKASDIAGHFIGSQITDEIGASDFLIADVTVLNFNVAYEVGFAIGRRKRLLLIRHEAIAIEEDSRLFGVYDTIGHKGYQNAGQLAEIMLQITSLSPLEPGNPVPNRAEPVYLLDARFKTDPMTRVVSRLKKSKLKFRSFDPNEHPRLSAIEAIKNVTQSYGVLLPLLPTAVSDSKLHNLRAAFLAGLAAGMEKALCLIQLGDSPVPLDYRDLARPCLHPKDIDAAIEEFATDVVDAMQGTEPRAVEPSTLLGRLDFGASAAENELRDLGSYYVETDAYKRALRGEVRMLVGRKGMGKSAVFFQVRDRVRENRKNVVLDLKPDGYQLLKFKQSVLRLLEKGTFEHTVTAFWEYLLLLEVCHKVLQDDRVAHTRDPRIYEPYRALSEAYSTDDYVAEGDFSERLALLIRNIENNYTAKYGDRKGVELSNPEITQLLHLHALHDLRRALAQYIQFKDSLWLLIDNLDKGWPPGGIAEDDVILIRCLDEAARKIARDFAKLHVTTNALIFLRQDVYELLIAATSDRGKEAHVSLDWSDADLLREMLRRRFVNSGATISESFLDIWRKICVTFVRGEESSQFLIDRCLMRPRFLIDLLNYCRGYAVNLRHERIEVEDIDKALAAYSDDLVRDIGYELRDVSPGLDNALLAFIDVEPYLKTEDLTRLLQGAGFGADKLEKVIKMLLWYGVLGILVGGSDSPRFIYDYKYNMNVFEGVIRRERDFLYALNPAFWRGLAIKEAS